MTVIDPNHREQIESWLGRPLSDGELQPVVSLDALTDAQLAVVGALRPRHLIAPLLFLRAVVPSAATPEIRELLDNIDDVIATRQSPELANLPLFEHVAGRALTSTEKSRRATLVDLSPVHLAIATLLAQHDLTVAFLYLQRIVPSAEADACDALVRKLGGATST